MRPWKILCLSTSLTMALLSPVSAQSPEDVVRAEFPFQKAVLAEGLGNPFEIRMGSDGWLWVTERTAGKLSRVNPQDATIQTAFDFDLPEITEGAQTGVMGFAFHPDFGKGTDKVFVYVSYQDETRTDPTRPDKDHPYHTMFNKVVSLDYDKATGTLSNQTDILTGVPANNDHNSGRIEIGPDGMIYLTAGEMGHNQLVNWCRPIEAQTLPTTEQLQAGDHFAYQGKVLRLNLDGSVPEDNPELDGVRSHIFSYGHRNPQGLAFGPDGTLYSNEHGPDTDDEINRITAGGNYGWPHVAGQQDDKFYVYARWSEASEPCRDLEWIGPSQGAPESVPQQKESEWEAPENYVAPLVTLFTVSEPPAGCEDFGCFCRPSVGPSSIAWYDGAVPELQGRLLTTAMKHGSIYAFDPAAGAGFTRYYLGQNRLRDIEIAYGGQTIYLVTDSQGGVQSEEGDGAEGLENPGAILVYTAGEGEPAGNAAPAGTDGSGATSTEAGNDAAAEPDDAGGQPASDPQAAAQEAERGEADGSPQTAPEGEN